MTSAPKTFTSPDSVPASGVKLKFREAGNCKASMHLSIQIPVIRSLPNPPYVPTDYNPVGAYIREFTVPAGWEGMDIFLDFEGVESAYYVWVNGELGTDMQKTAACRRTSTSLKLLKKGNNKLAVKVFRYSDGSYLEGQDYWKYSGIERSVYLYARPQSRVK